MAVEACHSNRFPPQLLQERDSMNPYNQENGYPATPFPATLLGNHSFHYQQVVSDSTPAKTSVNTQSGLTCNVPASRKRCRDSTDELYAAPSFPAASEKNSLTQIPSFVGNSVLPQIQQHQLEIDAIISQHTNKIKSVLQQRQKQQTKLLISTIGEGAAKKLQEKEEQIQKLVKFSLSLQETVKSLYIENQFWRDYARTNEATAISLRTNLEQALVQVGGAERTATRVLGCAAVDEEEVVSCCGSSDHGRDTEGGESCYSDRLCRRCGDREACVLLLPCRHLCLCNLCGSGSHQLLTCPVCNSSMNASLHVNMST